MNLTALDINYKVPVVAFNRKGEFIGNYKSTIDAAKKLRIDPSHIGHCLYGKQMSHKGYLFILSENYTEGMTVTYASLKRKRAFKKYKK